MSYWPRETARKLDRKIGYECDLADVPDSRIEAAFERRMDAIDVSEFL